MDKLTAMLKELESDILSKLGILKIYNIKEAYTALVDGEQLTNPDLEYGRYYDYIQLNECGVIEIHRGTESKNYSFHVSKYDVWVGREDITSYIRLIRCLDAVESLKKALEYYY